jgi:lysophospholipase L1-like esterase
MKCKLISSVLMTLALVAFAAAPAFAKPSSTTHYYLALGDSLSVGYQPNATTGVGRETKQGYPNQLAATLGKTIKHLKLVELGCPGDTTTSMLTGHGNSAGFKTFHCDRSGGSQLKAAERFLKAHHAKGEVALVTIDIGANDVDGCTVPATLAACLKAGEASIATNLPKILHRIRAAARAGTALAGMTLYDPFLAFYLQPYSSLNPLAEPSVALAAQVDAGIQKADTRAKFKTADVFGAFKTADKTPVAFDGQQVPNNVVQICKLTWMCAPSPVGPNIHANKTGYGVIAGAFSRVLGKL